MFWQSWHVLSELRSLLQAKRSLPSLLLLWSCTYWGSSKTTVENIHRQSCRPSLTIPISFVTSHFTSSFIEMREWWLFRFQCPATGMLRGSIGCLALQWWSSSVGQHFGLQLVSQMWVLHDPGTNYETLDRFRYVGHLSVHIFTMRRMNPQSTMSDICICRMVGVGEGEINWI